MEASPVLTIKQEKIVDKIVKSSTGELTVHPDRTKDISFAQAGDLVQCSVGLFKALKSIFEVHLFLFVFTILSKVHTETAFDLIQICSFGYI